MATICRRCALAKGMIRDQIPPMRTVKEVCDYCKDADGPEAHDGRNYHIPDRLIPGSNTDPNTIAEREEHGG